MNRLNRFPKMAWASLILLMVAIAMLWMDWITLKQTSLLNLLLSQIPALENGGVSFAEGRSLMGQLADLSTDFNQILGQYTGKAGSTAHTLITVLNISYQILFFGTLVSAIYCVYARLRWHSGLKEAIYFPLFIGNLVIAYFLMNQLNKLCGSGCFGFSIWGFVALFFALLSEILWEEASFNTPNPMLDACENTNT